MLLQLTFSSTNHFGRISNVLGSVDGTQLNTQALLEIERDFACRKGYHSINVHVQYVRNLGNFIHIHFTLKVMGI